MQAITLSVSSYAGQWAIKSQASHRSPLITKLVLPILAALDVTICVGLTCCIIPLHWLGKEHLSNTVGAIVVFVGSFFHLIGCVGMPQFDLKKSYLNGRTPIQQMILNHKKVGSGRVQQLCQRIGGRNPALIIAQWDIEFAAKCLREKPNENQMLQQFIATHQAIPEDKRALAQQLVLIAEKAAGLLDHVITKVDSADWAALLVDSGHTVEEASLMHMIKHSNRYAARVIQSQLNKRQQFQGRSAAELVANWDIDFARTILNDHVRPLEANILDFIKKYPKIPKLYEKIAVELLSLIYHEPRWKDDQGNYISTYVVRNLLLDWAQQFKSNNDFAQITEADIKALRSRAKQADREMAKILAKSGQINQIFLKVFLDFVKGNDASDVQWFLNNQLVDVNGQVDGESPLSAALQKKEPDANHVHLLLVEGKCDPNRHPVNVANKVSALLFATVNQLNESIRYLLLKQATFLESDQKVFSALTQVERDAILLNTAKVAKYINSQYVEWLFKHSACDAKVLDKFCADTIESLDISTVQNIEETMKVAKLLNSKVSDKWLQRKPITEETHWVITRVISSENIKVGYFHTHQCWKIAIPLHINMRLNYEYNSVTFPFWPYEQALEVHNKIRAIYLAEVPMLDLVLPKVLSEMVLDYMLKAPLNTTSTAQPKAAAPALVDSDDEADA